MATKVSDNFHNYSLEPVWSNFCLPMYKSLVFLKKNIHSSLVTVLWGCISNLQFIQLVLAGPLVLEIIVTLP